MDPFIFHHAIVDTQIIRAGICLGLEPTPILFSSYMMSLFFK